METIEQELNLLGRLRRLPAVPLIPGAALGVWGVFRYGGASNGTYLLIGFLAALALSVCLLCLKFDSRWVLLLGGVGLFGLYALISHQTYLQKRNAIGQGSRRMTGVYRGDHRFSVPRGPGTPGGVFYVSNVSWDRGDRLEVTARVRWPRGPEGFRRYLTVQGYHAVAVVETTHKRSPAGGPAWFRYGVYRWIDGWLVGLGDRWDRSVRLGRALILGRKEALPASHLRLFRRLGISHLFVISGLHVGLLFWVLNRLLEPVDRRLGLFAGGVVVFLYVSLLGWPTSAARAALMVGLYGLGHALWRRPSGPGLLVSAVVLLLAWDPFILLDVGFQLSVGAMTGIYAVHRYVRELLVFPGLDYLMYSTGAFFGVLPLVLIHFHYLPRWGFLFGWLGCLLFPLLLVGLGLQMGWMLVGWSVLADLGELVLLRGEVAVGRLLRGTDLVLTVSDVQVGTAVVLGALLWVVVDWDGFPGIQGTALAGVAVVLLAVVLPPTRPHLEATTLEGRPALFVHNPYGVRILALPPGVYPGPAAFYSLERYLRGKGVLELDVLVSTLTRRGLRRMEPGFVVDRLGVHGAGSNPIRWRGGGYDFARRRLDSYFASIRYNIQEFDRKNGPDRDYVLTCRGAGRCEVGERPDRRETARGGTRVPRVTRPIREQPLRWVAPGRMSSEVRVARTVEDRLGSFLPGF